MVADDSVCLFFVPQHVDHEVANIAKQVLLRPFIKDG